MVPGYLVPTVPYSLCPKIVVCIDFSYFSGAIFAHFNSYIGFSPAQLPYCAASSKLQTNQVYLI